MLHNNKLFGEKMKAQAWIDRKNPELCPGTESTGECSITSQWPLPLESLLSMPRKFLFHWCLRMSPGLFYETISVRGSNMENTRFIWGTVLKIWDPLQAGFFHFQGGFSPCFVGRSTEQSWMAASPVWLWKTKEVLILCGPKAPRDSFEIWKSSLRFIASLWNACSNTQHTAFWKHDEVRHLPESSCGHGEQSALNTLCKPAPEEIYGLPARVHGRLASNINFWFIYSLSHSSGKMRHYSY